jgi:hypothetical protein
VFVTSCNFQIRCAFFLFRLKPSVKHSGGHPRKSMDEIWRARVVLSGYRSARACSPVLERSNTNSISHGRVALYERVDRFSVNETNSTLCPLLGPYAYGSDSSFGKQFVEFRSREARILNGPWDSKPSWCQRYGSAVSVQLDFSGKHEPKLADRSGSFSAPFFFRGDCL